MKLPRSAAAPLSILVAVVLLMAGMALANAATKVTAKDKQRDVSVKIANKYNKFVDILDTTINTGSKKTTQIRFDAHLRRALGDWWPDKQKEIGRVFQSLTVIVRTNTDQYQFRDDRFGANPGFRMYRMIEGKYVDISDCRSDEISAGSYDQEISSLYITVPKGCLRGKLIMKVGFYVAQSFDQTWEDRVQRVYATDTLILDRDVAIKR